MNKALLLILLFGLLSCNGNKQEVQQADTQSEGLADTIVVQTDRRVSLLPEAQEQVSSWLEFATAYDQVEDLKTATGREIISVAQPVVQIMEALNTSLPDSLQEVPVRARTAVLATKANVLHQAATKKEMKAEELFSAANDIILEFDNFKLQLNELYLKTPADFELELNRRFEESQDSLRIEREAAVQEEQESLE